MRLLITAVAALLSIQVSAQVGAPKTRVNPFLPRYRIAVIDTGFDRRYSEFPVKLCPNGHHDYNLNRDTVGSSAEKHGTYVSTIIGLVLHDVDYCIYVFQVYGPRDSMATDNVLDALARARKLGVVAVNMSFRSGIYDWREEALLKDLSSRGIKLFAAAGNEARDLNTECDVYPACYSIENLVVVGALTADADVKASYSNYGMKVTAWQPGTYITDSVQARGTSFAAPKALGYYVHWLSQRVPIGH